MDASKLDIFFTLITAYMYSWIFCIRRRERSGQVEGLFTSGPYCGAPCPPRVPSRKVTLCLSEYWEEQEKNLAPRRHVTDCCCVPSLCLCLSVCFSACLSVSVSLSRTNERTNKPTTKQPTKNPDQGLDSNKT